MHAHIIYYIYKCVYALIYHICIDIEYKPKKRTKNIVCYSENGRIVEYIENKNKEAKIIKKIMKFAYQPQNLW